MIRDKWFTVEGELIEVDFMQHNTFTWEYFKKEGLSYSEINNELKKHKCSHPYELLHKRGWVRIKYNSKNKIEILGNCISYVKIMRNTCNPAMNEKQLKVAKRLCKENNTDFLDAINCY